jgi:hypothetical protein
MMASGQCSWCLKQCLLSWLTIEKQRRRDGAHLTNCTEGGGGLRGWVHSAGARRKIGDAHRGKTVRQETRSFVLSSQRFFGGALAFDI